MGSHIYRSYIKEVQIFEDIINEAQDKIKSGITSRMIELDKYNGEDKPLWFSLASGYRPEDITCVQSYVILVQP